MEPDEKRTMDGGGLRHVSLTGQTRTRVRDLSGFRKGHHRVPSEANSHTQAFVARIAAADLDRDLDGCFNDLRRQLGLRRTDLAVAEPKNGAAQISTPGFDYHLSVTLDPDQCDLTIWRREVCEFRDPEQVFSPGFAAVFGHSFDTVEFAAPAAIDIAELIDSLEDRNDGAVRVEYDRHATWCEVTIRDVPAQMVVRSEGISLVSQQPQRPGDLLKSFIAMRARLTAMNP